MTPEDEFKPKPGKLRDRGRGAIGRYSKRVRKAAAKLAKPARAGKFSGVLIGRGTAAARMANWRSSSLPKHRMRRVIVKTHIARASQHGGRGAFRAHVNYIQRDGVEREGAKGALYDRASDQADGEVFTARGLEDRHQFRLIVSPEDADELGDLKAATRDLMGRVERDLGTRLDWVAVDHYNTGHPHTHIVIRGKSADRRDLVVAKDYLTQGLRARASELVTERLGPRRDLDIARKLESDVGKDRFTGLDQNLAKRAQENRLSFGEARGSGQRFNRTLAIRRLQHLEKLGLAAREGPNVWTLETGWEATLKQLGRRGDIVRTMAAAMGSREVGGAFDIFDPLQQRRIVGRVAVQGAVDELRNQRFLVVDGTDGRRWYVDAGAGEAGAVPPVGAVVEVSARREAPKASDKTIARIAKSHSGIYSDAVHNADDPYSTPEYREAHKRRLEALRRGGVVEREPDGAWRIPADYLDRAAAFEAKRGGVAKIDVHSWISIEDQMKRRALTWLDDLDAEQLGATGFGREARWASTRRIAWLQEQRILSASEARLSGSAREALSRQEFEAIKAGERRRSGRQFVMLERGASFHGAFEKTIDGASRRFAVIGGSGRFTLATSRPQMELYRGQTMTIRMGKGGIEWDVGSTIGRTR